ncbi:uncharacterized protein K452DRAFT_355763 [Aplosporella prunicola CBS 121167]|uniref:Uncharacterized protein n=1 Tax=Aplosporella prunicola CBS 121167 TaxID=1176127 RepID=A0A6A6BSX3_9PEZI|nr:uncharacterized protein K452DRAFT_355763 [Aplosporella prunicola CBS 121167]KAF2146365.1 hypothetical protein K452DRAFT_355763 [Aplosporella prunicola CBS 121167]
MNKSNDLTDRPKDGPCDTRAEQQGSQTLKRKRTDQHVQPEKRPKSSQNARPGRPSLKWSPKQERALVRLILDTNCPIQKIPSLLKDEVNGFVPSQYHCRTKFKELTGANQKDFRLKDENKIELRRKRSLRAYQRYLETIGKKSHDLLQSSNSPLSSTFVNPLHGCTDLDTTEDTAETDVTICPSPVENNAADLQYSDGYIAWLAEDFLAPSPSLCDTGGSAIARFSGNNRTEILVKGFPLKTSKSNRTIHSSAIKLLQSVGSQDRTTQPRITEETICAHLTALLKEDDTVIHAQTLLSQTLLHLAAESANVSACQVLLDHHIDVYAMDCFNKGAIEYAKYMAKKRKSDTSFFARIRICIAMIRAYPQHSTIQKRRNHDGGAIDGANEEKSGVPPTYMSQFSVLEKNSPTESVSSASQTTTWCPMPDIHMETLQPRSDVQSRQLPGQAPELQNIMDQTAPDLGTIQERMESMPVNLEDTIPIDVHTRINDFGEDLFRLSLPESSTTAAVPPACSNTNCDAFGVPHCDLFSCVQWDDPTLLDSATKSNVPLDSLRRPQVEGPGLNIDDFNFLVYLHDW